MHVKAVKERVLITGGTGYIGANLAKKLVELGDEVHLIIRDRSTLKLLEGILRSVTLHKHDGTTGGMQEIMGRARPGVVFHLASLFLASHRPEDIEPMIRSNILFGTQLVESMAASKVNRLINTGTSWQHYESKPYSPVCLYAATKQAFEAMLQFYLETTPLRALTLRLFDTYGPDDPRPKLFTVLRDASGRGASLDMSAGEQLLDLVYIQDVVDAFITGARYLIRNEAKNECFAVGSGKPIRLRDLVEMYSSVTGKPLHVNWGARPYRNREVMVPWSTGKSLPGWSPAITLEEGIRKMETIL